MHKTLIFFATLAAAAILAVIGTTPPSPLDSDDAPDAFAAGRAMADVRRIARTPHPSGSAELAGLRGYLVDRLEETGLTVRVQEGTFPAEAVAILNQRSGDQAASIPLVNVIATLPGKDRRLPAIALMAHYDGVFGSPAAADDGAGVASILEALRALAREKDRARDVLVVFTDGEESGLNGARLFFAKAPERHRIGAIINLETRGGGGTANLFQTSAMNGNVARFWARSSSEPAGTSLATFIYSLLPNDTDLTVALPQGAPAWNFAFIGRPGLYHSPLATPANLDEGALQQMGAQTLDLARALATARELPGQAPDIVFFDVFGLFVAHYAPAWGWAMLVVGIAGYLVGMGRERSWRDFAGGAGRTLGLILAGGALLTVLNLISGAGSGANYYDRLAAIPMLQVMALLACLELALMVLGKKPYNASGLAGMAAPVILLALGMQTFAPVAAYILVLPVMLGGIAATLRRHGPNLVATIFGAVAGALVAGYAFLLGFSLLQAVGPTMLAVAVLPLLIACIALVPLRPVISAHPGWRVFELLLLFSTLALALWIRFDPIAPTVAVYSEQRLPSAKGG